jgi:hypothetical protein
VNGDQLFNSKLHPKSINILNGSQHLNPTETFNLFSSGLKSMNKEVDLEYIDENQIQFFVKECENFQVIYFLMRL